MDGSDNPDKSPNRKPEPFTGRLAVLIRRMLMTTDSASQLILRITLAIVIFPHGMQKVFGLFGGYGFSSTMESFTSAGFPWILGFLDVAAESLGALFLFFGLFGRISALAIATVMIVAAYTHFPNGFFMNWFGNQAGEGFEFHLLAIAIAAAIVIRGSGAWSIDNMLFAAASDD